MPYSAAAGVPMPRICRPPLNTWQAAAAAAVLAARSARSAFSLLGIDIFLFRIQFTAFFMTRMEIPGVQNECILSAVQEWLKLPWHAKLSEEEAQRGLSYYGSGNSLRRLAKKLLSGHPITVVAIGGSVTAAGGSDPAGVSYIARFFTYINATFPHAGHVLRNKGMGAWSSSQFEPCLQNIVAPVGNFGFLAGCDSY